MKDFQTFTKLRDVEHYMDSMLENIDLSCYKYDYDDLVDLAAERLRDLLWHQGWKYGENIYDYEVNDPFWYIADCIIKEEEEE